MAVTWNPNDKGSAVTLSNGDLTMSSSSGFTNGNVRATKGVSSEKWYWEIKPLSGLNFIVGIGNINASLITGDYTGNNTRLYSANGKKYPGGLAYGAAYTVNDTIGVALDMDAGTLTFYKNGVSQGVAFTDIKSAVGTIIYPYQSDGSSTEVYSVTANFGATAFAYAIPSGYLALDSEIPIPEGVIVWNPNDKGSAATLSNGNLTWSGIDLTSGVRANLGKSSGKWYWELTIDIVYQTVLGIANSSAELSWIQDGTYGNTARFYALNGLKYPGMLAYGATFTTGDKIGVALDMDLGTLTFYKNGVSQGVAFTDISLLGTPVYPYVVSAGGRGTSKCTANFGATAFAYPIPDGYLALSEVPVTETSHAYCFMVS